MKLVVLGATGATGLEIVSQAIERGHSVTAFVRAPDTLRRFGARIVVIQGDALNGPELQRVVQGHDAVLSAFGPRLPVSKNDATLLQRFTGVLVSAMWLAKLQRVAVVSTALLFKDSVIPPAYLVGRLFFPDIVRDAGEMENILKNSELDWTIVRPPRLTNKSHTGKYRAQEGHLPAFGFTVSRADVADFMIKSIENQTSVGRIVGICN